MEASREEILKALEQVIDPELKRDVVELDMVRDVLAQDIYGGGASVPARATQAAPEAVPAAR